MARRTTQITLSDSADITTVDNNFQTIENYLVCDYVESDLATLKTNHPASVSEINKKCKIDSDNTIYKCKLVGGNYSWEKDYENGIIYATYAELKALKDAKGLVAGQKYRITDYVTTVNSGLTEYKSAGHQFDLIIEALDSETFSEDAKAIQHEGDTYFANCRMENWSIKYSFNNIGWSDTTNGKGVILLLEDENGNVFSYDFKNIMRKVYKITANTKQTAYVGQYGAIQTGASTNTTFLNSTFSLTDYKYCYTFNYTTDSYATCNDLSIESDYVLSNKFGNYDIERETLEITLWVATAKVKIYQNTASNRCDNTIFICGSSECFSNSFGNGCANNSFGNNCADNSFGSNCASNSFGNGCTCNSFESRCYSNSLGNSCSDNIFGQWCGNNTFNISSGGQMAYNTFNGTCRDMTWNVSGYCMNNFIASSNKIYFSGNNIQNIFVTTGCSNLTITSYGIKVLATKSNVTYSTAGQVITS